MYKIKLLEDTLTRLENNMYTGGLDTYWCCCAIDWLWKWRKITESQMIAYTNRVIALHD